MSDTSPNDINEVLRHLIELLQRGDNKAAVDYAATARNQFPTSAELIRLHGVGLLRMDRRHEALMAMNRAAELAPDHIELQCNLASLAMADGKVGTAIDQLHKALTKNPGHPALLQALGAAYMTTGQHSQARDAFALAVENLPQHPAIRLNLAAAELELGRMPEAELQLREVLKQAPSSDTAHVMLGHMLHKQHRPREAAAALIKAGQLSPSNVQHMFHAALMLEEAGDLIGANDAFAQAHARAPESVPILSQWLFKRRQLCRWQDLDSLSERVIQAVMEGKPGVHPFAILAEETNADLQLRCAKIYADSIEQQATPLRRQLALRHALPLPDSPIRIGMLSDGFHETAVGQHLVGLIEALTDSDLDIHLFATTSDDGGPIRRRLATAVTLHDVSALSFGQIAALIQGTTIEILFDLNSYRSRGNAQLMALRPAPIQIAWLGFPGSSGASWMDYLLTDIITLPDQLRPFVSEKVIRMSRCPQPNDPARMLAKLPTRQACGLPEDGIVFAYFHETHAISPAMFARCMLILQQVPNSILWLLSGPADTDERLRQAAIALDVAPERLIFMPQLPYADYLARYAYVDLYLDTLPTNARATALDALWAGCPVLTHTGTTMAGRTVTSLLHQMGLPELITSDSVAFISMATALAKSPTALRTLRRHLVQQRTQNALFNMESFAADFGRVMHAVSTRFRIGRPPIDFDL